MTGRLWYWMTEPMLVRRHWLFVAMLATLITAALCLGLIWIQV